jgi:hypothetical protein
MIQRVQSIYLLLITVMMSFLLLRSYAEIKLFADQTLIFRTHGILMQSGSEIISVYKSTIPVIILTLLTALLSFCTIFFFNHRILQIRLCMLNAVLIFSQLLVMFIYFISTLNDFKIIHHAFKMPMIYPILSIIFCLMASRNIQKDEALVNSYNRIR